jgi:hypothetical protein
MCSRRGLSLGTFKATDSPRKRVMIAVKLEGKRKKGSSVDVSFIATVNHLRKVLPRKVIVINYLLILIRVCCSTEDFHW